MLTFDLMNAPIITLTSDWGYRDHYAGAVKGRILSTCPGAQVVDITHGIEPFHHAEAAFVLRQAFSAFPEGSIHIIGVDTVAGLKTPHCVVRFSGHYFIGADNGIFSLIIGNGEFEMVEIDIHQSSDYFTFSTRDVFVEAAAMLVAGKKLSDIGPERKELNEKFNLQPIISKDGIQGQVILTDAFRNAITNIPREAFHTTAANRSFRIEFSHSYSITELSTSYDDVKSWDMVALFGSHGNLEIALNRSNAAELLGLQIGDKVTVIFE